MFDPGGAQCRLHFCPFVGTWRALFCGEVNCYKQLVAICSVFSGYIEVPGLSFCRAMYKQLDRCFSAAADKHKSRGSSL